MGVLGEGSVRHELVERPSNTRKYGRTSGIKHGGPKSGCGSESALLMALEAPPLSKAI